MSPQLILLQQNLDKLPEKDRAFAADLVQKGQDRPLSEKQMYWVGVLANRAIRQPDTSTPVTSAENFAGIVALINRNNKGKWPKIRFHADGQTLTLSRAGERARYPGSLNVTVNTGGIEVGKEWLGRIHQDGRFELSSRTQFSGELIVAALKELAADPETAAREYGKKTGHCCFCGLGLDDERSLLMGYGPVCAKNYGLSWGDRPAEVAS